MSETDWEFHEDGSCTLSQYDKYEFKTNVICLSKKHMVKFLEEANKHSNAPVQPDAAKQG